jgi:predicted DNA-binding transcriptional regulator AlpA
MKGRAPASYQERWNDLGALRSVLTATGGEARIEEVYRVLGAEEAARFLGVSESQVRHLTCRRELPCIKTGKRGVGYRLIDLINWQEARLVAPLASPF